MNSPKRLQQSSKPSPSAPRPIAKLDSVNLIVRQCSSVNSQRCTRLESPSRQHSSFASGESGYSSYTTPEFSMCLIAVGTDRSTMELFFTSSSGLLAISTSLSLESSRTFMTLCEQFDTANDPRIPFKSL